MDLCYKELTVRGKYKEIAQKKCYREHGHVDSCDEFHYLMDLAKNHPRVANKIKRDATKTTGAAWKSEDAGPNNGQPRLPRC